MPGRADPRGLAQTAALLSFESPGGEPDDESVVYFVGIDGARFKRPVEPGDQLILEAASIRARPASTSTRPRDRRRANWRRGRADVHHAQGGLATHG
jgi:3-hydroxymyristoyl/3-hydroxydecanoyl-(acyl carrier protein) dehydratase